MHETNETQPSLTDTSKAQSTTPRPVVVGFDLDGVLFFNPFRIVRKPVELLKKYVLHRKTMLFYIPRSPLEKIFWKLVHMSSLSPAHGWKRIRTLAQNGSIEAHLITARFACLKSDFDRCVRSLDGGSYFKTTIHNAHDEQPHLFKERMIKELGIKYYIEDNWNIVDHLSTHTDATILWITNAMDLSIDYPERFNNLDEAMTRLEALITEERRSVT